MRSSQSLTMKQIVMDGDPPLFPEEIIRNIFKRLPVKSLLRFQCVCKHWQNLFKTSSFIADHLHHSTHHNPFLLSYRLHLLDCQMQVLRLQKPPLIDYLKSGGLVGSSNGLLCIEVNKYDVSLLLWNPAIIEVRQVPKVVSFFEGEECYIGFGFSAIVNDYKIIRIYLYVIYTGMIEKAEVYSLSTGFWKEVESGNLHDVFLSPTNGFSAKGAIFWLGSKLVVEEDDGYECDVIISFDIATEVFTLIPIPPSVPKSSKNRLTMYENNLAMLSHTVIGNYESSLIELWVIKEGTGTSNESWCWTKKYTVTPYPGLLHPVTIWRNEIVCVPRRISETGGEMEYDEPKTILFNLTTKEFKMFAISISSYHDRVFNYAESLVPVGGKKLFAMFV